MAVKSASELEALDDGGKREGELGGWLGEASPACEASKQSSCVLAHMEAAQSFISGDK